MYKKVIDIRFIYDETKSYDSQKVSQSASAQTYTQLQNFILQLRHSCAAKKRKIYETKQKMAFGSALVFPGGKIQKEVDQNYSTKYSLNNSLESAALRETFQETGLFFADKPILQSDKIRNLQKIRINYIANVFNNQSNAKQIAYKELSELLYPTRKITPFIRMITIPLLKHRYDTTFFVLALQDYKNINFFKYAQHQKHVSNLQKIVFCDHEYTNFRWMNPAEILKEHFQKTSLIAPPQFIMLNIMLRYQKYQEFVEHLKRINPETASLNSQNYNLGPNIISLVSNSGRDRQKYPYAATLVGDKQFPYDKILENQICEDLRSQIRAWKSNQQHNSDNLNRFLFKESKGFFDTQFDVVCNLKQSIISEMKGWNDVQQSLHSMII